MKVRPISLGEAVTAEVRKNVKAQLGPNSAHASKGLWAERDRSKEGVHWFEQAEPRKFKIEITTYSNGDISFGWVSGTRKRGNTWRIDMPFAVFTELHKSATDSRAETERQRSRETATKEILWEALYCATFPDQADAAASEIQRMATTLVTRHDRPAANRKRNTNVRRRKR